MIARRLIVSLALFALVSNVMVVARPNASGEGQAFTLMSLKHESAGALTRIMIESNAPPLYTVFRPSDRLIIVDLPGGEAAQARAQYAVKSALVDSISVRQSRVGGTTSGRAVTRIEIAVKGEVRDRSVINGNMLVLELSSAPQIIRRKRLPRISPALSKRKSRVKQANAAAQSGPSVYVNPVPVRARATTFPHRPRAGSSARGAQAREPRPLRSVRDCRGRSSHPRRHGWRGAVQRFRAARSLARRSRHHGCCERVRQQDLYGRRGLCGPRARGTAFGQRRSRSRRHQIEASLPRNARRVATRNRGRKRERDAVGQTRLAARPSSANREIKVAGQRVENQKAENQKVENQKAEIRKQTASPNIPSNLIAQAGKPASSGAGQSQTISASRRSRTRACRCPTQPGLSTPAPVKETIVTRRSLLTRGAIRTCSARRSRTRLRRSGTEPARKE